MMLLRNSAVLYFSLFACCHASDVTRMRPRGTGGGVDRPDLTYRPIPSPTKAPSTRAPNPVKTQSPTPKVDIPISPIPFPPNVPTTEAPNPTESPTPKVGIPSSPFPSFTKAPTTQAPNLMKTESPTAKVDGSPISPSPVTLTPDEFPSSDFPSSALEPTTVSECLARARNTTDLPRLNFLVTMTVKLSDTVVPFLFRLREFLQTFVATDMLNCGLRRHVDDMSPIRDVQFDLSVYNSTLGTCFVDASFYI